MYGPKVTYRELFSPSCLFQFVVRRHFNKTREIGVMGEWETLPIILLHGMNKTNLKWCKNTLCMPRLWFIEIERIFKIRPKLLFGRAFSLANLMQCRNFPCMSMRQVWFPTVPGQVVCELQLKGKSSLYANSSQKTRFRLWRHQRPLLFMIASLIRWWWVYCDRQVFKQIDVL